VNATARYGNNVIEFELLDNGNGYPDALQYDGIYSAMFVPPVDSENVPTTIAVTVTKNPNTPAPEGGMTIKLIPVDQEFGCIAEDCGTQLEDDVNVVADLPIVTFINTRAYPNRGVPEKVAEFSATRQEDMHGLLFSLTAPKIIGGQAGDTATKFTFLGAERFSDFFAEEPAYHVITEYDNVLEPTPPGETLDVPVDTVSHNLLFFRVVAHGAVEGQTSMSSIERIDKILLERTTTPEEGNPGNPPTTTPPNEEDEDKPFFQTAGGIVLIIFLVLLGVGGVGGGYWWYKKKQRRGNRFGNNV